jgi:hypothetical protein
LRKKQLAKRLTDPFLQHVLQQFNEGQIDCIEACCHLQISQAHLYRLRSRWIQDRSGFTAHLSGGGHWPDWPPEASQFLKDFIPLQKPPNFQLAADELAIRFGFKRHRQSVAAFVRTHFPNLVCHPESRPKARRRWERSRLSELWQHDSSIHQWWPAADKQTLLLTVDDHSRKLLGAVFVPTDTTWNHFEHFRRLFIRHCLPLVVSQGQTGCGGGAAVSLSGTACLWWSTPMASAFLAMIPCPMTGIPVPSSNAPSRPWA